jgi:hypothetical protein
MLARGGVFMQLFESHGMASSAGQRGKCETTNRRVLAAARAAREQSDFPLHGLPRT